MRAAIFLDRDGTLIEDGGFLRDPAEVSFFAETVSSLARLHGQLELFIVTNQSGIARGIITREEADKVNAYVVEFLAHAGVKIRDVYVCPHAKEDRCECHKPGPFFLREAARDHQIDLSRSFVIGDHPADVDLAEAVGATGIYVLSGHGARHQSELTRKEIITSGIAEAIDHVLVKHAARTLRESGLVAFPTETVYGLGANALDRAAVAKIYAVKGRPPGHPLIVHLSNADALEKWAAHVPEEARILAERFWPGALTIILPKRPEVPDEVTGGQNTVGLRVPKHPLARAMIGELGVAAPSANKFGRVSPTEAAHVLADLGSEVDFVLDGGPCEVGLESTIVDLSSGTAVILRPGGVSQEEIEAALGKPVPVQPASTVRAPGMFASHYAPKARVLVVETEALAERIEIERGRGERVAVLSLSDIALPPDVIPLQKPRTTEALAHDLYRALRDADDRGATVIVAEAPPKAGLGLAIIDRLKKASV
jgi:L-threonylcarbamoyladenylate synthase